MSSKMILDPEIESLKQENQKIREYISLISAQTELTQRIHEIKQNFINPPDSARLTIPILDNYQKFDLKKYSWRKD